VPRESRAENFIKNELIGKVFPVPTDDKNEACAVENDLEALDIGIDAEKRSIEVLSQLAVDEKKMDVRMIFNHLLIEERKHLAALEELKKTLAKK
jgi:rubrerythrin